MNISFLFGGRNNQIHDVNGVPLSFKNKMKSRYERYHFERELRNWYRTASISNSLAYQTFNVMIKAYYLKENYIGYATDNLPDLLDYTVFKIFVNALRVKGQIPPSAYLLSNLQEIYADELNFLSDQIGNLSKLSTIEVYKSQIKQLPDSICNLTYLKSLTISAISEQNQFLFGIQTLPLSFGNLKNLTLLDLGGNRLEEVSQLGELENLQYVDLSKNHIRMLPDTVGKLSKLQTLILSNNHLSSIPNFTKSKNILRIVKLNQNHLTSVDWIWNCQSLERLFLSYNMITQISNEIDLPNLRILSLMNNQLESIPNELSNLSNLRFLELSENRLTHLPTMSNLVSLTSLDVSNNILLNSLPMGLLNSHRLTNLQVGGTNIPASQRCAFTRILHTRRHDHTNHQDLLNLWSSYSGEQHNFDFVDVVFNKEQKENITEWLLRLQNSADFFKVRENLAKLVCQMIETLRVSKEFRDDFFNKLEGNLDCCGDRAAMLLNLIYTDWVLCTLDKKEDLEKIVTLRKLARTLTLRKVINEIISAFEKRNKDEVHESVEIYIHYETKFTKELDLLTAIKHKHYSLPKKHEKVVNEAELIKMIKKEETTTFLNLAALDKLLENNVRSNEYKALKEKILSDSIDELEKLEMEKQNFNSEIYVSKSNQIKERTENKLHELKRIYVKKLTLVFNIRILMIKKGRINES